MNNSILSDYCPRTNTHTFNIVENLQVTVTETANPFQMPVSALFSMAARINKKRSFLFVSKVLGKHIPVNPYTPLLSGAALGLLLYREMNVDCGAGHGELVDKLIQQAMHGLIHPVFAEDAYHELMAAKLILPKPAVFIGFAETATALGHSMYNIFAGNASYIHTTREDIPDLTSVINFEEEHSHAVDHLCYALDASLLSGEEPVILVDDEITTGNTAVNTIRDIQSKFPRQEYVIASLLDWRTGKNLQVYKDLEQELGITIKSLCLLQGSIEVKGIPLLHAGEEKDKPAAAKVPIITSCVYDGMERLPVTSTDSMQELNKSPYLRHSGRFGLVSEENAEVDAGVHVIADQLRKLRTGERVLVMGVGEFMYLPMRVAAEMGEGVSYQSTTRSPIHPNRRPDYGVHSAAAYPSAGDPAITNFIYNVEPGQYDEIFVLLEREVPRERIQPMTDILRKLARHKVHLVVLTPGGTERIMNKRIAPPVPIGSYPPSDVTFLLKDLSGISLERATGEREEAIQSGVHYSEMLPVESQPTSGYLNVFHETLRESSRKVALAVAVVSEIIWSKRGPNTVLVSLARAGTPVGVLIKRYIAYRYQIDLPHYSISIIRGKGIDENALLYMLQKHGLDADLQFIDGWTGKGAIRQVLIDACKSFYTKYGIRLNDDLAVLADPGHCSATFGTREDFLIPSACLNSTVSGLVSRTVLRDDLIGPDEFHGAKFYKEWTQEDVSNEFIEAICPHFPSVTEEALPIAAALHQSPPEITWQGLQDIRSIQELFGIANINLIKPGVGETTRVLLRRVPWRILVDSKDNPNLRPILLLAEDRGVPVEAFPGLTYSCCGIIKPLKGESE
jgi:hypothetical protein